MNSIACLSSELNGLVADVARPARPAAALKLADRFDGDLSAAEAGAFDEALLLLAEDGSPALRAELSRRLARVEAGPVRTVRDLALDEDAGVAGPVLRHSPLVPEEDLVAVARSRGQEHLAALAERPRAPEPVTDAVAERGSWPILRILAANDTARLSRTGLARLAHASRGDGHITVSLTKRPDAPPELKRRLLDQFRAMAASGRPSLRGEDSEVDLAAPAASLEFLREDPLSAGALAAAEARVGALCAGRALAAADVARCLDQDRWADAVAAVARLAGEPTGRTAAAFREGALDEMLLLMRLADLDWPLTERILLRRDPKGPGRPVARQRDAYLALSRRSAAVALRVVQSRRRG